MTEQSAIMQTISFEIEAPLRVGKAEGIYETLLLRALSITFRALYSSERAPIFQDHVFDFGIAVESARGFDSVDQFSCHWIFALPSVSSRTVLNHDRSRPLRYISLGYSQSLQFQKLESIIGHPT